MRLEHPAGESLFVDWAGMTADIFDPPSGEVQPAQIFVAVLAASGYTYAEATATQQLPDWIGAHCRAFAFFNGVSQLLVPDNTKTGITKACFYEPDINPSYLGRFAPTKPGRLAPEQVAGFIRNRWPESPEYANCVLGIYPTKSDCLR